MNKIYGSRLTFRKFCCYFSTNDEDLKWKSKEQFKFEDHLKAEIFRNKMIQKDVCNENLKNTLEMKVPNDKKDISRLWI